MNSSINIQIGEAIRIHLENKGLLQRDVAETLNITQGAVSAYYRGKPFGKNAAQKWSDAFGFRVNWLLTGEGEMLSEPRDRVRDTEVKPLEKDMSERLLDIMESQKTSIDTLLKMLQEKDEEINRLRAELDARKGGTASDAQASSCANVG